MLDLPDLDSADATIPGTEEMSGKAQLDILYGKIAKDVKKCADERCKITSQPEKLNFAQELI